jgi:EamA domain-containing membrane protein RarD
MLVFAPLFLSPQASGKFIELFNLKLDTAAYKNILTPSAIIAADIVFLSFSGAIIYIPTLLITLGSCLTGKLGFVGVFQFLDPATAFLVGKLYMREQIIYNRFSMALIVVSVIAYLFSELVFKDKAAIHE